MKKFLLVIRKNKFRATEIKNVELRLGNVSLHKDLLIEDIEFPLGGGEWEVDDIHKELKLTGKSFDFGYPKFIYADKLLIPKEFQGYKITYKYPDYDEYPYKKGQLIEFTDNEIIFFENES